MKLKTFPTQSIVLIILTPAVLLILLILLLNTAQSNNVKVCEELNLDFFQAWTITDNDIPAEIAWQVREQRNNVDFNPSTTPNGWIHRFEDMIIYRKDSESIDCNIEPTIIALDMASGVKLWEFSKRGTTPRSISSSSTGILLLDENQVTKLDANGQLIWSNGAFPGRSITAAYSAGNRIYLPTKERLYVISDEGGARLDTISISNVHIISYPYLLQSSESGELEIYSLKDDTVVTFLDFNTPESRTNTYPNQFASIKLDQDIVVIFDRFSGTIVAFDTKQGNEKWIYNRDIPTYPILRGETIYVLDTLGEMTFLDVGTGSEIGQFTLLRGGVRQNISDANLLISEEYIIVNFPTSFETIAIRLDN